MKEPIFFAWTKSFAFTMLAIVTMLAGDWPAVVGFVALLEPLTGWDTEVVVEWLHRVGPAVLFLSALYQRSGAASEGGIPRPYTLDPRAI